MEINEENLNKYNLFYLREYAKTIGVKCPTALKKQVLIEKIIEIKNGIALPNFSNRGKPSLKPAVRFDDERTETEVAPIPTPNKTALKKIRRLCVNLISEIDKILTN